MDPGISGRIRGQRGRQRQPVNWRRAGQREDGTARGEGPSGGAQWEALDTEGPAAAEEEKRVGREGGGGDRSEDL